MFYTIKKASFLKSLKKLIASNSRKRNPGQLKTARTIGILFDAGNEKLTRDIVQVAEQFRNKGANLRMLAFLPGADADLARPYKVFGRKNLKWNLIPNSPDVSIFIDDHMDILLCFNPDHLPALHWIATASKAQMKVGYACPIPNDYDLALDVDPEKGAKYFVQQLEHYLENVVNKQHEHAAAV